ncbi:MAG: tdcB 1 [Proteobacteria bacterium]|nr:tdcB 1 [Pseudomonadota bacterium]
MDDTDKPITLERIRAAREAISGQVMHTPFLPAPRLGRLTGAEVFVKYENMQVTSAFKERGALNRLLTLSADERRRGVIAMSAGNHAQAVAYHAVRLGIAPTIVMPVTTPHVKVSATTGYGARVVLEGETVAEAALAAARIGAEENLVFIHPYDDSDVIAGQGTLALEMLEEPAAKALKPEIDVIGVETRMYPSMWAAVKGIDAMVGGATLAEGIAVKVAGRKTLPVVRELVDTIVLVDESHLERAVNAYLTLQKTMAEGAGAAGLAAMFAEPDLFRRKKVGLVLSGGNIDPRILASIMMRELAREEKIVAIRLAIPDRPGTLGAITTLIGDAGGNILEVSHRRAVLEIPAKGASLDITLEARDGHHAEEIIAALRAKGYGVERKSPE